MTPEVTLINNSQLLQSDLVWIYKWPFQGFVVTPDFWGNQQDRVFSRNEQVYDFEQYHYTPED